MRTQLNWSMISLNIIDGDFLAYRDYLTTNSLPKEN